MQMFPHFFGSPHQSLRSDAGHALREARLCRKTPHGNPRELPQTLEAAGEMTRNAEIKKVIDAYTDMLRRESKYQHLLQNPDHTCFMAFLLNRMLMPQTGERVNYADYGRMNIEAANPFGIAGAGTPEEQELFRKSQEQWSTSGSLSPEVMRKTIDQYLVWKNALDETLRRFRLEIPGRGHVDAPGADQKLKREEYFRLLVLVSEGLKSDVEREAALGVPALRTLLEGNVARYQRADGIYVDLVPREMGPAETLSSNNKIRLGRETRVDYRALREGRANPAMQHLLLPGESAEAWRRDPKRALAFLERPGSTFATDPEAPGNPGFLKALRYYADRTPER